MSSEDIEIAVYLRGLLDHELQCREAVCPSCAALRRMMELVRGRLFATRTYAGEAALVEGLSAGAGGTHPSSAAWHVDWVL